MQLYLDQLRGSEFQWIVFSGSEISAHVQFILLEMNRMSSLKLFYFFPLQLNYFIEPQFHFFFLGKNYPSLWSWDEIKYKTFSWYIGYKMHFEKNSFMQIFSWKLLCERDMNEMFCTKKLYFCVVGYTQIAILFVNLNFYFFIILEMQCSELTFHRSWSFWSYCCMTLFRHIFQTRLYGPKCIPIFVAFFYK